MKKIFLSLFFILVVGGGICAQDCAIGFCPPTITVHHKAGTVSPITTNITYRVITTYMYTNSSVAKCAIVQNLGATAEATTDVDGSVAAAGWYWQFNRKQGYYYDTFRIPSTTWETPINENTIWTSDKDPCILLLGTGWRMPTNQEWINADTRGGWGYRLNAYNSELKIHCAGCLDRVTGLIVNRGYRGYYWGSKQATLTTAQYLYLDDSNVNLTDYAKASGYSVRCLRDL